jgi:DNA-binding MarR family transcriptional regulator
MSDISERVLLIIRQCGSNGISRNELAERLNIDLNTLNGIINNLIKTGVIEEVGNPSKNNVKLIAVEKEAYKKFLEIIKEVPCFSCPNILSCGEGQEITPIKCYILTKWLDSIANRNC